MAASPIRRLPSLEAGTSSMSSFSIQHPLFGQSDASHVGATQASRDDSLSDAPSSAGPSRSPQNTLPEVALSTLDASGNADSANFSGSFFGSGSGSNSNGALRSNGQDNSFRSQENDSREDGGGDDGDDDAKADKEKNKKSNPLLDLLETEAAYVSELSKVIKKVAAAWSRSNFPPPELDTMFRNIEAIYRANRGFLKALREIGPNPTSPKALGDLLMKWIDDLDVPYTRYCENYLADFDSWTAVQSNPRLSILLAEISSAPENQGDVALFSDKKRDPNEPWTLDALFALPHIRLKYYKKLYSRLLKSTQPGRSDHRLLVGANEKLDELVNKSKGRLTISVLDQAAGRESHDSSLNDSNVTSETSPRDRVSSATSASDGGGNASSSSILPPQLSAKPANTVRPVLSISTDSNPTPTGLALPLPSPAQSLSLDLQPLGASLPRQDLSRGNSGSRSIGSRPVSSPHLVETLEERLDTSRTLDIFTMQPKKCQLQIQPENLPFKRTMRTSQDVVIYFTPSSGGPEIVLRRAHLFLLTDLFLVCERMTPSEKAERSRNSIADMWLLYPPLAGKHLRVADMGASGNILSITILKKEKLTVHLDSRETKEQWLRHFDECHQFAASMGAKLKSITNPSTPLSAAPSFALPNPISTSVLPGPSPAISVTPSSTRKELPTPRIMSPDLNGTKEMFQGLDSPDLSRAGSFNSVASFPKSSPAFGSPDLGSFAASSNNSPRSPSPSQLGQPGMPGFMSGRPPPPGPGRPPMMSPPNGMLSPESSPAFGPSRPGPGGVMARPPLMRDPGMPPISPAGMRAPPPPSPIGAGGVPVRPGPMPNSMAQGSFVRPGGPGAPPVFLNGPPGGPPPFLNGAPRPPQQPRLPPGAGLGPGPRGASNTLDSRDVRRQPSAPNLRQASNASSGRTSDEGDQSSRSMNRSKSVSSSESGGPKLPSAMMKQARDPRDESNDISPPSSPIAKMKGPFQSTISAQMRCKIFLKQGHAQWKSLGNAKLKLFHILPDDVRQLVVDNDRKTLISTIVLTDGVERVGKVGVAVELSDRGNRTGIVYMLQMRSEESAGGLFGQLLEGSDRSRVGGM